MRDWIDEHVFAHDRTAKRFILLVLAGVVLFAACTIADALRDGDRCDAACQDFIDRHAPVTTPTPFNPDDFINKNR